MSSLTSVSASARARETAPLPPPNQEKRNLESLGKQLGQEDLSGAQDAFKKLLQESPRLARMLNKGTGKASMSEGVPGGLAELSKALDAGDLEAAKKAYEELQPSLKRPVVPQTQGTTQVLGLGVEALGASSPSQTGSRLNVQA